MSRKSRHTQINTTPNISLYGDSLDRLLNGGFTNELRKQLPKAKEGDISPSVIPTLISKEYPLRAVFYKNHCSCGSKQTVFGYFCRKTTEQTASGNVTYYKAVEPNGPPQEITYQPQIVPFCSSCIPTNILVVE